MGNGRPRPGPLSAYVLPDSGLPARLDRALYPAALPRLHPTTSGVRGRQCPVAVYDGPTSVPHLGLDSRQQLPHATCSRVNPRRLNIPYVEAYKNQNELPESQGNSRSN